MIKFLRGLGPWALAAVLVGGGFLLITGFSALNPFKSTPFTNQGPTVVESIKALSELTSVEYVEYTTIEKGKDRGLLNWAQGERIYMFALARIGAGVDLGALGPGDVDADPEAGTVRVTLPPPAILYVEVDQEATQVYDRDTGLFTSGDKDLESEARRAAAAELERQALAAGILDAATENARDTLTVFLESLGYTDIVVEPAPAPDTSGL